MSEVFDQLITCGRLSPVGSQDFVPVSAEAIRKLDELGEIPTVYREFIRQFGCCSPTREFGFIYSSYITPSDELHQDLSWMVKKTSGQDCLSAFYGMPTAKLNGIIEWRDYYGDRIPENLLPVASTLSGNQLCIGMSGDEYNKIFLWELDSEIEREDFVVDGELSKEVLFWNIYKVYESFSDLVSRL